MKKINIALIGNPNTGKTSIFNTLTGTHQKVGNWSGVTVEKKVGKISTKEYELEIVDLPGIYSITPLSIDEKIAGKFLIDETPDILINILDASNLERNFYLTVQLLEMKIPMIVVLNMYDVAQKKGIEINLEHLETLLGRRVITTIGSDKKRVNEIITEVLRFKSNLRDIEISYGKDIEKEINNILPFIKDDSKDKKWQAIQILENNKEYVKIEDNQEIIKKSQDKIAKLGDDAFSLKRYGFISGLLKESVKYPLINKVDLSRKIDNFVINPYLGYPILFLTFAIMFYSTFNFGEYPMGWIESLVGLFKGVVSSALPTGELKNLVTEGIIEGIGSVIIFLPNILILFLFISIFEDTGYMARAAFLVDNLMHKVGLHGKSVVPMIMGFGCNVPAMMATRTIEDKNNRLVTLILSPLITCNARLTVYILIAGTFFPTHAGAIIGAIYALSIIVVLIGAKILTSTFFKTKDSLPFVMELPPYHMPTLRTLLYHMWEKTLEFLQKMGTVILVGSILIWVLSNYPKQPQIEKKYDKRISLETSKESKIKLQNEKSEIIQKKSFLGKTGSFIQPVFAPLGFDYKDTIAIIVGFVAKEVVVSTYGVLYHIDAENDSASLKSALRKSDKDWGFGLAFMIFILLYIPCLATLAVLKRESSLKIAFYSSIGYTVVAYTLALIIYRVTRFLV